MNSEGTETNDCANKAVKKFESSVTSEGTETNAISKPDLYEFESSVNSG